MKQETKKTTHEPGLEDPIQPRLRDSSKSRALIAQQFAVGGALDSQTSDSQFVRNMGQDEDNATGATTAAAQSANAPITDGGHGEYDEGVMDDEDTRDKGQDEDLLEELAWAQRRIAFLEGRLAYFHKLSTVHHARVQDLEDAVQTRELLEERERHERRENEAILDPNEQSQVLIYPPVRTSKKRKSRVSDS